ncbi:hypothetical protein PF005_g3890 [Phytophthora fragariae]|uniref:Hexosyltransferase n=2 Tax=Phytophthora fragariae TaxID=53985 RepID=A0A6A3FJV0_9STRA|nr:hypothetical protein PF003_g15450 [Phytophthora fragariae]KAE8946085.1 hypothetical protein PF009_g4268 [Phytophthora fragariae]KAE9025333.1 hypothetical protein PF011_g3071 [Phytophthora fragariae]KAE9131759.1 hypothetical protein PF010_g3414 [Phytophthora fragariae]KAE9132128.1 hypothetical protein PF007_g3835 [Phytophthora fragariae]
MREVIGLALALIACICSSNSEGHQVPDVGSVKSDQFPSGVPLSGLQWGGGEDPVTSLVILYPLDGAIETSPFRLATAINIQAGGADLYRQLYADLNICFEASNVTFSCSPAGKPLVGLQDWEFGNYTMQAFFTHVDDDGEPRGERYWTSQPVTFSIVSRSQFAARTADFTRSRQAKYRADFGLSLTGWASQQQRQRPQEILQRLEGDRVGLLHRAVPDDEIHNMEQNEELVLLVGVKTGLTTNFALRQAVRETWASPEVLPRGVKVLFVGCRPLSLVAEDSASETPIQEAERRRLREAIALEKLVYGDLLTDELDCDDSYLDLSNKVKEFLHVAATQYSHAQFVMLADDDVYVRADKLLKYLERLGPQTRYYSGQVPSVQHARKDKPNRDARLRYSLSVEQYPLSEVPPMAMGAYFFLSMDCAKFISKNRHRLRDLNGIDDITIPLWMLAIQVHVQHLPWLGYLRSEPCNDKFVAFGDLSPLALREVHNNLQEQRRFCQGFERNLWLKASNGAKQNDLYTYRVLPWYPEQLQFDFVILNADNVDMLQITTTISTPTHAGIKVSYFPSNETFSVYTRRVCAEARLSFPSAVNSTACTEIRKVVESKLHNFREDLVASEI